MRQSSGPSIGDSAIAASARVIGERYEVLGEIGKGGMGRVYRVRDRLGGEELALKELHEARVSVGERAEFRRLFEREFHALAQLAHPCIIAVRDYGGVEDDAPYYTMELLSGVSLREKGRLAWPEACRLLRDVASALALLHSRRYLHRDVTPRNIQCSLDGRAKLIDFGLMAPAGVQKTIMGTPPFVAPEAVHLQPLDGRADLYGLGATAYWVLTGRNAFNARKLSDLRDSFRSAPLAPSLISADVPEALSRLVLSLLSLDPNGRPSSAAEVIEQLNGIAGLESDETLAISAAYLSTPKLVGRRGPVLQARRQFVRALRGQGSLLLIEGDAGVGRSRFLDACMLEAKLLGFSSLRADASDGATPYGVVHTLARQLTELRPNEALDAAGDGLALLARMLPVLADAGAERARAEQPTAESAAPAPVSAPVAPLEQERSVTQEALRQWFLNFTRSRALLIAVDDIDQIDEPSAALLATLGASSFGHKLMLVATAASDRTPRVPSAYQVLTSSGQRVRLRELDASESLELLSSVFGRVPNVELLADRLHHAALGNPRALVELAEHLVAHGAVRYDAGAWSLPRQLDAAQLPDSLEQVRATRIAELPEEARALAQVLSLSPAHIFSLEEAEALCDGAAPGALHHALDALMAAGILSLQDRGCSLSHRAYVSVLAAGLAPEARSAAHAKLAAVFERRAAQPYELAWHFQGAGDEPRAIAALSAWLEPYMKDPNRSPHVGAELKRVLSQIEQAIERSECLGRPRRERLVLRSALVAFGSYEPSLIDRHGPALMAQLSDLSGLLAYHALDASLPAEERLRIALTATQARYDASSEFERVLAPIDAIRQLARCVAALMRVVGGFHQRTLLELVPAFEPLFTLAPQLRIIAESCSAVRDLADGNFLRACEVWRRRLEVNPDVLSICYALGLVEASIGVRAALERAERCESDPAFRIQAWRIRMVFYLVQGDAVQAETCRRTEERLRIQHGGAQELEGSHLQNFLIAYARADDLMGVKHTMDALAGMAKCFEAWEPFLERARAEYHRLRGDLVQALFAYEHALSRMQPARHAAWYTTIESQLLTLLELDRVHEARMIALNAIELCEAEQSLLAKLAISRVLALVEARLRDFARALPRIDAVIAAYEQIGVTGMILAGAFETRARIALELDDRASFEHYARRCAEVYDQGRSSALKAKFARLLDDARKRGVDQAGQSDDPRATLRTTRSRTETVANTMHSALEGCRGANERAEQALRLILKHMRLESGFLYTLQADGIELSATRGGMPPGLDGLVERFIADQAQWTDMQTELGNTHSAEAENPGHTLVVGNAIYRPLLLSSDLGDRNWISGVVVVRQPAEGHQLLPHDVLRAASDALIEAGDVVIRSV